MPQTLLPSRDALAAAWLQPEAFTTTLLALFIDTFGTEGFEWDPDTIYQEIRDECGKPLDSAAFSRLMVGIQLLTTDKFFTKLPDFISFCNIMSGDVYDPLQFDPADVDEIAWGITEALLLDQPADEEPFSKEIRMYIGEMCRREGLTRPPDVLQIGILPAGTDPESEYADDPELLAAIRHETNAKATAIRRFIMSRVELLLAQLSKLPLREGDVSDIIEKIKKVTHPQTAGDR